MRRLWFFLWYMHRRYQWHAFHAWFAEMHYGGKVDLPTRIFVFRKCLAAAFQDYLKITGPAEG